MYLFSKTRLLSFLISLSIIFSNTDKLFPQVGEVKFNFLYVGLPIIFLLNYKKLINYFNHILIKRRIFYYLILVYFSLFVSIYNSYNTFNSLNRIILFIFITLSALFISILINKNFDVLNFSLKTGKYFILISFVVSILQVIFFITGFNAISILHPQLYGDNIFFRLNFFFIDPNLFAFYLAIFLIFFIHAKNKIFILLSFTLIIFTLSRSTLICLLIVYLLSFLREFNLSKIIFTIIFILLIFIFINIPFLHERFSLDIDYSGGIHYELYKTGISNFLQNPLIGNGYGSNNLLQEIFIDNKYANYHSTHLTFLAEAGIFGFLSFELLFICCFFKSKNNLYKDLFIFLFFTSFLYQFNIVFLFWLVLFLIYFSSNEKK